MAITSFDISVDTGTSSSDFITNDTSLTVTGFHTATSTAVSVTATSGGFTFTQNTVTDLAGGFGVSFTGLSEGNWSVTVSDGTTDFTDSFTIDLSGPATTPFALDLDTSGDTGANSTDNVTSDTTPTISGFAAANASVAIYANGLLADTVTANGSGVWTYTFSSSLPDGSVALTARELDEHGNAGASSTPLMLSIDATAPVVTPSALNLVNASDTGVSNTDEETRDTTPTINGTAAAGANILVFVDGVVVPGTSIVANGSGIWSYTFGSALEDGTRTITAREVDLAGNASAESAALVLDIDSSDPGLPPAALNLVALTDTGVSDTDDLTNDTTPTISGTATAGSYILVYVDGALVTGTSILVDGLGAWNYTFTTPLSEGVRAITAREVDVAGNVGPISAVFSFEVDVTPPSGVPADLDLEAESDSGPSDTDNYTNVQLPTVSGTATPGATVVLFLNGFRVSNTNIVADEDGAWSYVFTSVIGEGLPPVTAAEIDAAGNVGTQSAALNLAIDTAAPTVAPSALDLATASDSGASATDNETDDTTPTITGTAAANATVQIYLDGTLVEGTSIVANGSGAWTYTFTEALADAVYALTAREVDLAGNLGPVSSALTLTIDDTDPTGKPADLDVAAGDDTGLANSDNISFDPTPQISGTATAGATIHLFVNGTLLANTNIVANGSGAWSYAFTTALAEGARSIVAREVDIAGNLGPASDVLGYTVDLTAPTGTPSIDLADGSDTGRFDEDDVTLTTAPTIGGTATAGAYIVLYVNGAPVFDTAIQADQDGAWSYTFTDEFPEGDYAIRAREIDIAGNLGPQSPVLNVTVDTTPPATVPAALNLATASDTGFSSTDNITPVLLPTITGTGNAGNNIQLYVGEVAVNDPTDIAVGQDGTWTYTFTSPLPNGDIVLTASQVDLAGNVGSESASLTIVIDDVPPDLPLMALVSDTGVDLADRITLETTPTISGTAEENGRVRLSLGDTVLATAVVAAGGTWTYTLETPLADGTHSVTATAIDLADNESEAETLTFVTDTAPPDAPILSGYMQTNIGDGAEITFSGTSAVDTVVTVRDGDDNVLGSAVTAADGTWSVTATLADDGYVFSAVATDLAGNSSARSNELAVFVSDDADVTASYYEGPVASLELQFIGSAAQDAFVATAMNDFVNLGAGDDAVDGGLGNDVLDGGTGSNFMTGGAGADVFYTDARSVGNGTTWSTIADWSAEDQLNIFGYRPGVSRLSWVENAGADGYRGATLHVDIDNNGAIDASVTFAGRSVASIEAPVLIDGLIWFL